MSKKTIIISTDRPDVMLREFATSKDDDIFFDAVEKDREYLKRFAPNTVRKYRTIKDVTEARLKPGGRLRLGIWGPDGRILGAITATPGDGQSEMEVGYWVCSREQGHGYATAAVQALTDYLRPRYQRVFAEVHVENEASMRILHHAGYVQTGSEEREWGPALVFEAVK